jgi:hypothetical protein
VKRVTSKSSLTSNGWYSDASPIQELSLDTSHTLSLLPSPGLSTDGDQTLERIFKDHAATQRQRPRLGTTGIEPCPTTVFQTFVTYLSPHYHFSVNKRAHHLQVHLHRIGGFPWKRAEYLTTHPTEQEMCSTDQCRICDVCASVPVRRSRTSFYLFLLIIMTRFSPQTDQDREHGEAHDIKQLDWKALKEEGGRGTS